MGKHAQNSGYIVGCGYGGVIEKIKKIDIDKLKPKLNLIEAAVLNMQNSRVNPQRCLRNHFTYGVIWLT